MIRSKSILLALLLICSGALPVSIPLGSPCPRYLKDLAVAPLPPEVVWTAKTRGWFVPIESERLSAVAAEIGDRQRVGGVVPIDPSSIRRVPLASIQAKSSPQDSSKLSELHERARSQFPAKTTETASKLIRSISHLGYRGFSSLHITTSGAGNWRRGARLVKAAVPLNMADLLSEDDWAKTSALMAFLAADVQGRANLIAQWRQTRVPWMELVQSEDFSRIKSELLRLIKLAQIHPDSLSPIEIKYVTAALLSANGYYMHFDIFTSRGTHASVADSLREVRENFKTAQFVKDPKFNEFIRTAIGNYIEASRILGETHLVGFQEEVPPFSVDSVEPLFHLVAADSSVDADAEKLEEPNGIGAGVGFETLDRLGRTSELLSRGVLYGMFSNIEVVSIDLPAQFGAFLQSAADVGVVVVPIAPGQTGGKPFEVLAEDGKWRYRLIEDNVVPTELLSGNETFNTNTFYYRLGLKIPLRVDSEKKLSKSGQPVLLGKVNAGIITDAPGAAVGLILGEIGRDYQNFKSPADYGRFGPEITNAWRSSIEDQFWDQSLVP